MADDNDNSLLDNFGIHQGLREAKNLSLIFRARKEGQISENAAFSDRKIHREAEVLSIMEVVKKVFLHRVLPTTRVFGLQNNLMLAGGGILDFYVLEE